MEQNPELKTIETAKLRDRAEKKLQTLAMDPGSSPTGVLLHELQIHQLELEMQNAELLQARDEIGIAEERYADLYDFAPVGYVTLDCFGAICRANLTAACLLGIDRTRLIGRSFSYFVTRETNPLFTQFLEQAFSRPEKTSCEVGLTSGGHSPLFVQIEGVLAHDGEKCRAALIDISRRRSGEEKIAGLRADLERRAADLAAANSELEAFNFMVSHDLRTPLTIIGGYCQLLRDQKKCGLDEQSRGYLEEIYAGSLRMNRLINLLLKFSSTGQGKLHPEMVNLSSLAADAARELEAREPGRQVFFSIDKEIIVKVDSGLMRLVLQNLLAQAWKATGAEKKGSIEFRVTEVQGEPIYFVRDNGAGFDMALADQLFTPFQRLPGGDREENGIGLATVERIVRRHGGRIWAESKLGKGATFYFTLTATPLPSSLLPLPLPREGCKGS